MDIAYYFSPNRYSREFTSHSMSNCTVLTVQHVDVHTLNLVVRQIDSVPYNRYKNVLYNFFSSF